MKKVALKTIIGLFVIISNAYASSINDSISKKSKFYLAKQEIENMLNNKADLSYEKAIYLIENAYDNKIEYLSFKSELDYHTKNIEKIIKAYKNEASQDFTATLTISSQQKKEYYNKALVNYAIFTYMSDTTYFLYKNNRFLKHISYKYSYQDPFASKDWSNTQVNNLLKNNTGNCFALASFFKIMSERLNSDANICTAPGHIYISHADNNGIMFNVELASASFPGSGTIETVTYTSNQATNNGISLRTLNSKQSVALTLVYLAKAYQHTFKTNDDFILKCSETTLQFDSLNLNAMLLRTEIFEDKILSKHKSITKLQSDKDFKLYEKQIAKLYKLGYREMPLEMKNIIISNLTKDETALWYQDHNPISKTRNGIQNTPYASLSNGMFNESQNIKPTETFNQTIFDTKTLKIKAFQKPEATYNNYIIDPTVFAWGVDPLADKYADLSPYVFVANSPILLVDKDGNTFVHSVKIFNEQTGKSELCKITFDGVKATVYNTVSKANTDYASKSVPFVDNIIASYNYITKSGADIDNAMQKMATSSEQIQIVEGAVGLGKSKGKTITYNFEKGLKIIDEKTGEHKGNQSPALGFWSEVYHSYIQNAPENEDNGIFDTYGGNTDLQEDYVHLVKETKVIEKLKEFDPCNTETPRTTYGEGNGDIETEGVDSATEKKP